MNARSGPLNALLPEIFPIVASLLPLHATPSTLLSLALVNHKISTIILPLVYSRLILKNENDALKVLQKLLDNPGLGKVVREIHILSDLSLATRNGENPFDVVRGLEKVIAAGSLPYIHTLGIYLLSGWHHDDEFQAIEGFGQLPSAFWEELKKNCPRVRGLVLRGIDDGWEEPWLDASGLLEIQDITSLTLSFGRSLEKESAEKLLKNIASLCGSLHTLDLVPCLAAELESATPLFPLQFPYLRSLSVASLSVWDSDEAMEFWVRHPTLEDLKIVSDDPKTRWFTNDLPSNFLPNLRHLKANFNDIRVVAPILHQLVSLTVYKSVNAQIPYLLRSVLPEGLPNLKSLGIHQKSSASGKNVNVEGSLWYETEDGKFLEAKFHRGSRSVWDGCMHSIVRGAPNLEEIGFIMCGILSEFAKIAPEIAGLSNLKRFYYPGDNVPLSDMTEEERAALVSYTQILAEACGELTTVSNNGRNDLPYVTARISRDDEGKVVKIDLGTGYGMHFGNDDDAFPWGQ